MFPATYNINYYQGDLWTFSLYPTDTAGDPFVLTGYSATFKIANARTDPTVKKTAVATVQSDRIDCSITPTLGSQLVAGTVYVYDIAIHKTNIEYTLVTGTITVTAEVPAE